MNRFEPNLEKFSDNITEILADYQPDIGNTSLYRLLASKSWELLYVIFINGKLQAHCCYVIMGAIAPQITSLTIVYSTINSGAAQRKHQSSGSLAFVQEIHRWPVNSPHKWPVTRKIFPFDDVIMWRKDIRWAPEDQPRYQYMLYARSNWQICSRIC